MTNEEAKSWIENRMCMGRYTPSKHNSFVADECFVAGQMAIESLALMSEYKRLKEKDTAKKPIHNHHCPNCEWSQPAPLLTDEGCSECFYPEYCAHCGQHIDWAEEKERYEKINRSKR